MNLGKLTDQAKQLIGKRGGMDSVKEDAVEVKDIAQGEGSMQDKAKAAAEALKDRALRASPRTCPLPSRKSSTEGASNPTGIFGGSSRDAIAAFKHVLDRARIPATVRLTRGRDIAAACGQLAATR